MPKGPRMLSFSRLEGISGSAQIVINWSGPNQPKYGILIRISK
jgi:hypothetical protein